MIKIIIYALAFYFILKAYRIITGYFKTGMHENEGGTVSSSKPASQYKVDKKDIIEAEFEEIEDVSEKK